MTNRPDVLHAVYKLARFDVFRLFWMFVIVWLIANGTFAIIEILIWGERFVHIGDLILLWILAAGFGYTAFRMGLALTLDIVAEFKSKESEE